MQAKTATFATGMADAAKTARGAFTDIKSGAGEAGSKVGTSMTEARYGVVLLAEEFGVHLPRGITTFLATLGPVGAAMEAAFPFMAVAYGAGMLLQHLQKLQEEGRKLTADQITFGTAVQNAWNTLDEKILTAQKAVDDLKGDHLAGLKAALELIDKQDMTELVHSFEEIAKAADVVMKDLEGHWYTFGKGSEGAKNALDDFQRQYNNLLAGGKDEAASGLLHGTLAQAQHILALQKEAANASQHQDLGSHTRSAASVTLSADANALKAAGVGWTEKEIEAQQNLIDALNAQIGAEQRIADLKKLQDQGEILKGGKAGANDAQKRAEAAARLAEIMARVGEQESRDITRQYNADVQTIDDGERRKIDATKEGSAARLAAIDAAIKEEEDAGYDGTNFYRDLLTTRVQLVRQMAEEQGKLQADAAKEDADNTEKMAELSLAAEKQADAASFSFRTASRADQAAEEERFATEEYLIKLKALLAETNALDSSSADYLNKLKAQMDKEKQLTQAHENELASIKEKATEQSNNEIISSYQRMVDATSAGLTQSIMGHETWSKMILSLGDQVVSGMMENAIKSAMLLDFDKEKSAAKAAREGYLAGMQLPFPANLVAAPVLAAGAFAAVMAFAGGTDAVPGVGRGDTVPAMLTPGEGVVPGGVMDGLRNVARNGGFDGGGTHFHVQAQFAPHIHAVDGADVDRMLEKHGDRFQRHLETTLRKLNK